MPKKGKKYSWLYRNFRFKLAIAIPVIVTSLVAGAGIVIVNFSRGILSGVTIDPAQSQQVANTIRLMTYAYFISVGFAFVIAVLITYAISRPIEKLIRKARDIAAGNFAYDIDVMAYDEFSILEKTFNDMAMALNEYKERIEEYNRTLENKVKERTRELRAVLGLSREMIFVLDRTELFRLIMNRIKEVISYRVCGFFLFLEEKIELSLRVIQPLNKQALADFKIKILDQAKQLSKSELSVEDLALNVEEQLAEDEQVSLTVQLESLFIVPLIAGGKTVGLMAMGSLKHQAFGEDARQIITTVANHAALAIENIKVYDRLRELDQMKTEFVSNVSHELRTPMTAIKEGIDLVSDTVFGQLNEKQLSLLEIIRRNTERLSLLINELLDLSKIESGKIQFRKESLDIVALSVDTIKRLTLQADKKNIHVQSAYVDNLPKVLGDKERTAQVFTNLIGNAIKFTPQGGNITVSIALEAQQKQVQIAVANTGEAIPKDKLAKIFDKFYQLGRTAGAGSKGTGLGLSIAQEIVQRQGGKIWAKSSKGVNKFIFTLPAVKG